jgi:moderate conductance mechanosensitive channel
MSERQPIGGRTVTGAAIRAVRTCLAAVLITAGALTGACAAQTGSSGQAPAGAPEEPPAQVRALLNLLADTTVQKWLEQQGAAKAAAGSVQITDSSVEDYLNSNAGAMHEQIVALAHAIPNLPYEFERAAARLTTFQGEYGRGNALLNLAAFLALGFGAEWLFRKMTGRARRRLDNLIIEATNDRLRVIAARFALALSTVVVFAIASVGPLLALDWDPTLRGTVLGYLTFAVVIQIAFVIGHLLLAPDHERFRIIPMDTAAAQFWFRRITVFAGWFALVWVIVEECSKLGFSFQGLQLVAYTLGLGTVAIALESVWRGPIAPRGVAEATSAETHHFRRRSHKVALSVGIVLLWMLWVTAPGILAVSPAFWLILVIMVLPYAILVTQRAVEHLLRPPRAQGAIGGPPSVITVCLERGIRALLILGAVALLARSWGLDVVDLAGRDTPFARIAHGMLSAVVILLVANLLWHAMKTAIDHKLAGTSEQAQPNTTEARRQARLRTLLPIFRNVLFVVVFLFAAMMALSALGINIGPLIAGAGVLGIAIGLGAQPLVRDVIAGMFYLLDDAFRVGEYIQSGTYEGTVESFSFRSVRLRHQLGALYTVPFGLLGAVQNHSRDWVIDNFMVGITYDSDIDRARALIKQIGLDLAKDREFAPLIIEPLKMKGVDALGDFAVQIQLTMMTLPGENSAIRQQALAMIKKAFGANGIKFAFPTVQIAGESKSPTAAVAHRALQLTRPAEVAE